MRLLTQHALNVKILNFGGICDDELTARLYFVAHENVKIFVSKEIIIELYLLENPVGGIHCCLPKLFGIHFAESLVTLYADF